MKFDNKQLIDIVGTASIVLSLLFVGFQLLLERRVAEADIYFNRAESMKADTRILLESGIFIQSQTDQWESGWRPNYWNSEIEEYVEAQSLPTELIVISNLRNSLNVIQIDNLYFQYKQGLFPEQDWIAAKESIRTQLSNPLLRAQYTTTPLRNIQELLAELENDET